MKATRRYQLEVNIDSGSRKEMIYALRELIDTINSSPERYDRRKINDAIMTYELQIYGNELEYREEQINGIWCQIYKSKMS